MRIFYVYKVILFNVVDLAADSPLPQSPVWLLGGITAQKLGGRCDQHLPPPPPINMLLPAPRYRWLYIAEA